ncbi:hypothetical protein [Nocardia sp. NPDC055049]
MRVRKDGTTYSQVRYRVTRDGKTVQSSQSFDDHGAAIRWAKLLDRVGAIEAERVLAAQLASTPDVIMLTPWLRRHVDLLGGSVEEETKRKYRCMIDHDITPFFNGNYPPVDAVTPDMDVAWVEWLANELGNAPKTIANKHGLLCSAIGAAARRRPTPLIAWNPCAETKLPKRTARVVGVRRHVDGAAPRARRAHRRRRQSAHQRVSITKAWKWANGRLKLGDPKSARGIRTTFVPLETVARLDLDRDASEQLFEAATGRPPLSRPSELPVSSRRAAGRGDGAAMRYPLSNAYRVRMNLVGDLFQLVGALITGYGLIFAWERMTSRIAGFRQQLTQLGSAARAKLTGHSENQTIEANDTITWTATAEVKIEHPIDTTAPLEDQVARLVQVTRLLREEMDGTERQIAAVRDHPTLTVDEVETAIAEALSNLEGAQTSHSIKDLRWALTGLVVTAIGIVIGMF